MTRLQKLEDEIIKGTEAKLLCQKNKIKYWLTGIGYEGIEVLFTTCLILDDVEYYPTDDEPGECKNPNFNKQKLYLDIPNIGYCNWNSGQGEFTNNRIKTNKAINHIVNEFKRHIYKISQSVYSNSNY